MSLFTYKQLKKRQNINYPYFDATNEQNMLSPIIVILRQVCVIDL